MKGKNKALIQQWLNQAIQNEIQFVVLFYSGFKRMTIPLYAKNEKHLHQVLADYTGQYKSKIVEVYDVHKNIDNQLNAENNWEVPEHGRVV